MASYSCFSSRIGITLTTLTTIIFFIVSFASSSSSTTTSRTHAGSFTKIYAFGDSFTDTGNTRSGPRPVIFTYGSSRPPYGTTFFHHPTNRYSDGRLVIDFVSETLSLPYLPPYLDRKADTSHGVNFAVAGATAVDHDFYVKNNMTLNTTPQSIHTQLLWFRRFLGCRGPTDCKAKMEDALFWVGEIGANDYGYFNVMASAVSSTLVQELAIKSVTDFLRALLKMGAKYIVVQGLPPVGCLSLIMTVAPPDDRDDLGCVASLNKLCDNHNSILQPKLQELRGHYPQAIIVYADYWNAYRTVMKNKSKYGFKELFKVCCGSGGEPYNVDIFSICGSPAVSTACPNPCEFINWDGAHLTESMYKVVAQLFFHDGYCHPSFDFLLSSKRRGG